ncbi:hypothetical protein BpOF4_06385 [Alkalihalophilus pseudofirmus OF4]|jgi:hypothetical protein|uniref:Uncharacterized protein n=2 Tax=Alkalihalophilus pseudofirmus TaxID=79885 RepID=D3G062_ALKPO|nr:hypothetical protein [Alkalihalophilus pseudofirmus]ADC49337.1 hypothetical protein BpOF4_06385 [Alkalihalophilus pseudofirmus OF4]MDV2886358.1 hypothetical protein [Alkalihalophilus pseudofirmus]
MDSNIQAIEMTVKDLLPILKRYDNGQINYQIGQLEEILTIVKSNNSDEQKKREINLIVDNLYPTRGGLTDFNVWKEDTGERIRINKPISELNDRLWNLVKVEL